MIETLEVALDRSRILTVIQSRFMANRGENKFMAVMSTRESGLFDKLYDAAQVSGFQRLNRGGRPSLGLDLMSQNDNTSFAFLDFKSKPD